jgi:hypothetical protein
MAAAKRTVLLAVATTAMLACGCGALGNPPGASLSPSGDLTAASAGLCRAIAALPDTAAAQRTFVNSAHAALHALAAAPGLDRSIAAGVLESMQRVEGDFATIATQKTLTADLQDLTTKADAALRAIGQIPAPCV